MSRLSLHFGLPTFIAACANPGNPNTTLGNWNFGKITSTAETRILELALRNKF